jgi:uncharacterized membrane protein YkgB
LFIDDGRTSGGCGVALSIGFAHEEHIPGRNEAYEIGARTRTPCRALALSSHSPRDESAGSGLLQASPRTGEGASHEHPHKHVDQARLLKEDLDYHLLRASMVIIFLAFGYQKWFEYEAQVLIPYISNGPLIFWMYPVFGIRGASWFLGVSEWLFGALLFLGFWNKKLGILGALGSCATFASTVTIIPFMPHGWDPAAGFPAMAGNVPFLVKDVVLLAVSIYLLKQDVLRVSLAARPAEDTKLAAGVVTGASAATTNP